MEVLTVEEVAIHRAHDAVEHVGGSVTARETVGLGKKRAFVAEFEDLVEDDTGEVVRGPGAQGAEALGELRRVVAWKACQMRREASWNSSPRGQAQTLNAA